MTHSSRKRVRSMEDESSEFTPLSKRINNLHLNGFSGIQESTSNSTEAEWKNRNYTSSSNDSEPSTSSSSCKQYPPIQNNYASDYRPDLNANDNPYYYENNKLLYSLYMERMNRRSNL
ncbi:uncharacterized protein LOC103573973 [Microplitis demolitor]|uniref:uncharacterized protein LOC103573973 n=1 Tax=Microplitis demolitor TaxID=69319 RepID=UPI0004CCA8DA|nr:uncharacterized protein LOC103573973 [Microplitis demolitor]